MVKPPDCSIVEGGMELKTELFISSPQLCRSQGASMTSWTTRGFGDAAAKRSPSVPGCGQANNDNNARGSPRQGPDDIYWGESLGRDLLGESQETVRAEVPGV